MSDKLVDAWPASTFEVRIMDCFMMLKLHSAMTDREADAIKKRIAAILRHRQEALKPTMNTDSDESRPDPRASYDPETNLHGQLYKKVFPE